MNSNEIKNEITVIIEANDHTITMNQHDSSQHKIGDLTIRIVTSNTDDTFDVWGWRNNSNTDDIEVEVATLDLPEPARERTDVDITFTLTQQQVDDALERYDEIWERTEDIFNNR